MKPFSILLIRVLGLYLFLSTLFSVMPVLLGSNASELWSGELLPVFLATTVVPMVGGVLLWCFAGRLAERLHGEIEAGARVGEDGLVRAGTFLIGVYLLVRHFAIVVGSYASEGMIAYESLIVAVLSLCMLLGTRLLGTLYSRLKTLGLEK